jgi:hypothetical protein
LEELGLVRARVCLHGSRGRAAPGDGCRSASAEVRWRMRLVYLVMSVLPTLAIVTLAVYVIRAVSVRIVWR